MLAVSQETLTNTAKHAAGAKVTVAVLIGADTVTATVTTIPADGQRNPDAAGAGTGLFSLAQRCEDAGGHLAVTQTSGHHQVTAALPRTTPAPTQASPVAASTEPSPEPVMVTRLQNARAAGRRRVAVAAAIPLALCLLMLDARKARQQVARLTERERDVLRHLAQGCSNGEIGARLHLTEGTVKGHVTALLRALAVRNRVEAALIAYRAGTTS